MNDATTLLTAGKITTKGQDTAPDYGSWEADALAEHIQSKHHHYVYESIPVLLQLARNVAAEHGKAHSELIKLESEIDRSLRELLHHMEREEKILFPALRHLAELARTFTHPHQHGLQFIQHAMQKMRLEHEGAGEDLRLFRRLTHNYHLPEGACNSYRFLYQKLEEFETDLRQHIHLENNILFPKALDLLKKMAA